MDIRKFCDKTIRVETETDDDNENAARKPKLRKASERNGTRWYFYFKVLSFFDELFLVCSSVQNGISFDNNDINH
jgi:hypothetical protein